MENNIFLFVLQVFLVEKKKYCAEESMKEVAKVPKRYMSGVTDLRTKILRGNYLQQCWFLAKTFLVEFEIYKPNYVFQNEKQLFNEYFVVRKMISGGENGGVCVCQVFHTLNVI
jgi:hypothetical protein